MEGWFGMSLPAKIDMSPNREKPIRGYITRCPICNRAGTLMVHLLKRVTERGKRAVTCVACDFEGELWSHKVKHTPTWQKKS